MKRRGSTRPTDAELAILRVLWRLGPSTVRAVHDALAERRPSGYTTVLKFLQIMTVKKLVRRRPEGRSHVYEPRFTEEQTQRQLLSDLLDRAFGGSSLKLVMQALSAQPATPSELAEIRRLIAERETESR
jgi:predicted transcriptional regulator